MSKEPEKTVRMVFNSPFTLKVTAEHEIKIHKGVNHIPESLKDHWYLQQQAVPETGEPIDPPSPDAEAAMKLALDLERELAAEKAKAEDAAKAAEAEKVRANQAVTDATKIADDLAAALKRAEEAEAKLAALEAEKPPTKPETPKKG